MKATLWSAIICSSPQIFLRYSHYSHSAVAAIVFGRSLARAVAATSSVFRLPKDDSTDYIKRVTGCPATASR